VTEKPQELKQTTPKGLEIPVPEREQVMDALAKVAPRQVETIVSADEAGQDRCHLCGAKVDSWRKVEIYRRAELATGFYCVVCGEHAWGFRGPLPS